jgi:hypothetical protein
MRIVGFTFVRNGILYDYPFTESIKSLLSLCDEVVIAVGNSDDATLSSILSLNSPKIRIIETIWDESLRSGGLILSQQTNIALDQVKGDWAVYLQADEVIHEKDYSIIKSAMSQYKDNLSVEGLLFNYKHFFGSYNYIGKSRRWYRREIRIIRPEIGVRSWGDAQGFRIEGRKLQVKLIDASIYHYGWVKPPNIQRHKQKSFNKLWHDDNWIKNNFDTKAEFDYRHSSRLALFSDSHPEAMKDRISGQKWDFHYNENEIIRPLKERILDSIADNFNWRIGEYKNYELI